jgi:hypothetical protein
MGAMVRRRTFPQHGRFINKQKGCPRQPAREGYKPDPNRAGFARRGGLVSNSEAVEVAVTLDV